MRDIAIGIMTVFLLGVGNAWASCGSGIETRPIEIVIASKVDAADAVFFGKVTGFATRAGIPHKYSEDLVAKDPTLTYETVIVQFKVERWWKGGTTSEIELIADQTNLSNGTSTNSSGNYNFKKGDAYLVSATRDGWGLRAIVCNGLTHSMPLAKEFFKYIGEGTPAEK